MFSGIGQINMNSIMGNEIYKLCKNDNIRNIIEVGTWNGEGSTVCVMNAIMEKHTPSILYSFEGNDEQHNKATTFWINKNTNNKLVLFKGVLHKDCETEDNIKKYCDDRAIFVKEWYELEKQLLEMNTVISIDNYNDIDIIILDGGEYTTRGDFNKLIVKNPKVIILDDVVVFKCKELRQELLNNNEWVLYKENLNDRNGWCIFINKMYETEFM